MNYFGQKMCTIDVKQAKEKCLYLFKFFELPTPNRFLFARHLWAYLNKTANLLKITYGAFRARKSRFVAYFGILLEYDGVKRCEN